MDPQRFDTLARSLTAAGSRRRALAAILGGALGLSLGATSIEEAAARKKKPCPPCKKRNRQGKCKKKLPDGTACEGGRTCQNGSCLCASGLRPCGATCQQCCVNLDCEGGRTCQKGTCACPPDRPLFCTEQNVCGECCDNIPCCGKTVCEPREQRCFPNRTCGCEDTRSVCGNTGLCCLEGEICDGSAGADSCGPEPAPSDRHLKANFGSVDAADMLERVQALPISTWNYTSDDASIRHIGPMAQDFAALFGVGTDDRHIHPIDGQGVAFAAIQGLMAELEHVREEHALLAARLAALEGKQASG